ncbi:hypothetical protein [Acidovorax sp. HMWF029]|uniref:hypothetical protein n=1 Tax=Acidovorax sp. HMWF029 TaxID=2056863 RepID=UPI0011B1D094|nr:hypothetical protein [Acidovorax sp. HMWF029]
MQSTHSISIAQGLRQWTHPSNYEQKSPSPRDHIAQTAIKYIANILSTIRIGTAYLAQALGSFLAISIFMD